MPLLNWRVEHLNRSFATAVETPAASTSKPPPPPSRATGQQTRASLRTAVILNRSPVITRTPTPFERAYYAYQQRIARALHNPFPHEFYFKPGAPLEQRFNLEEARRDRRAFGKNFGADAEGAFTKPAGTPDAVEEDEALASRWTKADEAKDVRSLDRQGQRNLKPDELLHEVCWPCATLLA
jgi:large subunit ribosomal protein L46